MCRIGWRILAFFYGVGPELQGWIYAMPLYFSGRALSTAA